MSENTDYDKACREIARIAAALGVVDYSGDTSEIFDAIIIKDEKHQALAGENVVLKSAIEFATAPDMWEEHGDLLEYKYLDWYVYVLNKALDGTPDTTQALNEIEARAIENALDAQVGKQAVTDALTGKAYLCAADLRQFAANLRAGRKG